MELWKISPIRSAIAIALLCTCAFCPRIFWILVLMFTFVTALLLAVSGTITAHVMLSMKYQVRHISLISSYANFHKHLLERYIIQTHKVPQRLPVIFGRSVDIALQDMLDLVVQDLISPWLKTLAFSHSNLQYLIKREIWFAMSKLHERLTNIEETKLIAIDVVTKLTNHFEKIRSVQTSMMVEPHGVYYLSNHLVTPEKELNYLRKISELILINLFSKSLLSHAVNKNLLIEMSACKVLQPLTALVTDPNYINVKILDFVTHYVQNQSIRQQNCTLPESYQEFIQLIQSNENVDHLKRIRYNIVTEIMQATTIQNLRKSKDLDKERYQSNAKKLKRYLNQLTFAKTECETRLKNLGYPDFYVELHNSKEDFENKIIVPFEKILDNPFGKKMLSTFLENSNQEYLLIFWGEVEELRGADKSNWHQIAAELYYTFIHSPTAPIKVEKSIRRRMESFLLGNSGPEVFYEVQEGVLNILKKKIYPSFISSEYYSRFLHNSAASLQDDIEDNRVCGEGGRGDPVLVHTGYEKNKLNRLQERLNYKSQALQALKISLKPESKVLSGLQKEVENLEGEKRQLEAHMNRTEVWSENLGKWRATVQSAEIPVDKEPHFVLVVQVLEDESDSEAVSTGWVVLRKLSEFHDLHRKLLQVWSGVKQLELPSQSPKFLFGKPSDKCNMEKAKSQIQKYLEYVLMDDRLNASEALYAFLSPSSEYLKTVSSSGIPSPKKNRFSFSTLFKSSNHQGNSEGSRDSDDEESLFDEDMRISSIEGKDAVAEPLYALLGEVFDLRGVFRWLRKTLIAFVQITYGRTINRQVGETVAWLFSEQMLHYYLQIVTQSWWPNGVLVNQSHLLSKEEKLKIRNEAKMEFINNIPEVLNNLVGQQNARRGAVKIFEVLQNVYLNKQLFYDILELLMYEIFPELRKVAKTTGTKKSFT